MQEEGLSDSKSIKKIKSENKNIQYGDFGSGEWPLKDCNFPDQNKTQEVLDALKLGIKEEIDFKMDKIKWEFEVDMDEMFEKFAIQNKNMI